MTEDIKLSRVFAIAQGSWGAGDAPVEAIMNWKKQGGLKFPCTIELRYVDHRASMDGMGNLSYSRCEKLPSVTITQKQADAIWNGIEVLNELCEPIEDRVYELDAE